MQYYYANTQQLNDILNFTFNSVKEYLECVKNTPHIYNYKFYQQTKQKIQSIINSKNINDITFEYINTFMHAIFYIWQTNSSFRANISDIINQISYSELFKLNNFNEIFIIFMLKLIYIINTNNEEKIINNIVGYPASYFWGDITNIDKYVTIYNRLYYYLYKLNMSNILMKIIEYKKQGLLVVESTDLCSQWYLQHLPTEILLYFNIKLEIDSEKIYIKQIDNTSIDLNSMESDVLYLFFMKYIDIPYISTAVETVKAQIELAQECYKQLKASNIKNIKKLYYIYLNIYLFDEINKHDLLIVWINLATEINFIVSFNRLKRLKNTIELIISSTGQKYTKKILSLLDKILIKYNIKSITQIYNIFDTVIFYNKEYWLNDIKQIIELYTKLNT